MNTIIGAVKSDCVIKDSSVPSSPDDDDDSSSSGQTFPPGNYGDDETRRARDVYFLREFYIRHRGEEFSPRNLHTHLYYVFSLFLLLCLLLKRTKRRANEKKIIQRNTLGCSDNKTGGAKNYVSV